MSEAYMAAVDLGASSGRVILGVLGSGKFELRELKRFPNGPTQMDDGIHWDAETLFANIKDGIQKAIDASGGELRSVAVDTWGVDYGRFSGGQLLEPPFNYRDGRTNGIPEKFFQSFPRSQLYAEAGLQVMDFNTIFQYAASQDMDWAGVDRVLLMPDLFSYWLCGAEVAEVTIASTTGLVNPRTRQWAPKLTAHLADEYGLPFPGVLPRLVEPGTILGKTKPGMFSQQLDVIAVGGHDTASAVASVPASTSNFAFISSGTWSLVGLELPEPVLSAESEAADFTNELGVDGTVRYLKNVMGLWVQNECMRIWREQGREQNLIELLIEAAKRPALDVVVDVTDDRLLPPQDMPATLKLLAAEHGQVLDDDPVAVTRCVMDSLALAYRSTITQAAKLAERQVDVVQIVGGGSQNKLLTQLTAEATGLPVVAGPVEGTAMGNLLVQARALGLLQGDLLALREVAKRSSELVEYAPGKLDLPQERWDAALELVKGKK